MLQYSYRSPALTSPRTTRSLSSPRNIKVKHQASDLSLSLHYLLLLGLGEVVLYVEGFSDFLWSFAFDHVGHSLAGDIQESLQTMLTILLYTDSVLLP